MTVKRSVQVLQDVKREFAYLESVFDAASDLSVALDEYDVLQKSRSAKARKAASEKVRLARAVLIKLLWREDR